MASLGGKRKATQHQWEYIGVAVLGGKRKATRHHWEYKRATIKVALFSAIFFSFFFFSFTENYRNASIVLVVFGFYCRQAMVLFHRGALLGLLQDARYDRGASLFVF